ncbi:MAG: hypothetical protein LWY06_13180 [Firmicutes bacterium]|nr:hypothetical protein [Bacillota bacterium]
MTDNTNKPEKTRTYGQRPIVLVFGIFCILFSCIAIKQFLVTPYNLKLTEVEGIPMDAVIGKERKYESVRAKMIVTDIDEKIKVDKNNFIAVYSKRAFNPKYEQVKAAFMQKGKIKVWLNPDEIKEGTYDGGTIYQLEKNGKIILSFEEKAQAIRNNNSVGILFSGVCGIVGMIFVAITLTGYISPLLKRKKTDKD